MNSLQIATTNGNKVSIETTRLNEFSSAFRGKLVGKADNGYDEARTIWNAMIDRKPALIAQCSGAADVLAAVNFAREYGLLTAVRGGGHNIAGNAVCEGGLMIDLSSMRSVRIDPGSKVGHVEPGAILGDFDHEAQAFGLATPLGINSTTGVAGLTLGGGFGWLTRKYGMTVDNLTAVDVVTSDGRYINADTLEHPDLLWAAQGGGGNVGVVTRFEFQLYPVGPEVYSGLVVFPLEEAASALKQYREYVSGIEDETSVWVVMRKAPPLPFLPEKMHGREIIAFACFHAGNLEQGKKAVEPVRGFGNMVGEHLGMQPYTAWQAAFDPLLTPGARNYWKSHNFTGLDDEVIDVAVKYAENLPTAECEIFFGLLGGQASRIKPDATAYPHRDANFVLNVHGRWQDAADDDRCISWARDFFQESAPYATGGVYVNFLTDDETERVHSAYGVNYDRLAEVKKSYDPENLFRLNQNVSPTG